MNLILSFIFGLLFSAQVISGAKSKERSSSSEKDIINAQTRSNAIASLSKSYPVITLTDKNFTKFVTERPRLYHAAVLFTATGPKYGCDVCVSSKSAYMEAANLYQIAYDYNTTLESNRMAFFILEVDGARNTFQDLGLETVPRFYILPSRSLNDPKVSMANYEVPNSAFMAGPKGILKAIEEITSVQIHSLSKPGPLLFILVAIALVLALFISHAVQDIGKAVFWYQNRTLWTLVSLVCFSVGVSGSIFCIIKSAPLYGYGRAGIRIFAGQGRDQFLLEGIIVALLTIGSGIAITIAYYVTKLPFPVIRHIGVILALSTFVVLSLQVWEAYIDKTKWYKLRDTLPAEVWWFMTSSVKKTSTLPKRLVRISEIWLFEYKDWNGFAKKFRQLVVDYVVRCLGLENYLPKSAE